MKIKIGARLKEARDAAGLTQTELAKLVGVKGKQAISNWEHDLTRPNMETLELLAQHLNISVMDFYCNSQQKDSAVFIGADGEGISLDSDDPLVEAFRENQQGFAEGRIGARVTPQMVIDAAKERDAVFESYPYMKPFWTLMKRLATEHQDTSDLLSCAKLTTDQVALIAEAIRDALSKG